MDNEAPTTVDRERENARQRRVYRKQADSYDRTMGLGERFLLGDGHREWACGQATGDTLEVAVGTGLNLPLYPAQVDLTAIDLTPEMLDLARTRADEAGVSVEFREADAQDLPFEDTSFDTAVCTYSLCTIPDHHRAIDEMVRVLRPGGRLVLVDHTSSTIPPLYWLQQALEAVSSRVAGEYWTRRPLEHVRASELELVAHDRLRAGVLERLTAVKPPATDQPDGIA